MATTTCQTICGAIGIVAPGREHDCYPLIVMQHYAEEGAHDGISQCNKPSDISSSTTPSVSPGKACGILTLMLEDVSQLQEFYKTLTPFAGTSNCIGDHPTYP